jgi:hypothetical protein
MSNAVEGAGGRNYQTKKLTTQPNIFMVHGHFKEIFYHRF